MKVILASASPRRQELMGHFPFAYTVAAADIDETMDLSKPVKDEVARLSCEKAKAVPHGFADLVIGADTVVVCGDEVLGKPKNQEDAFRMLRLLSGRTHQVMTGLCLLHKGQCITCTEVTDITFRPLTDSEILAYIRTGEPMDKAGAYGIQGGGALFAETLTGDYYNVVGLPVCRLACLLRQTVPELMEEFL